MANGNGFKLNPFPAPSWWIRPSGTNLQGFVGILRWFWDAPLPAHLIGGSLWLGFSVLLGLHGYGLTANVVALLAVQQGAKWDSVPGYGIKEIAWRLVIGMTPLAIYLLC